MQQKFFGRMILKISSINDSWIIIVHCYNVIVMLSTVVLLGIFAGTPYIVPSTCTASDCHLQDPLPLAMLSPNLLIILIFSNSAAGEAKHQRNAIRGTWARDLSNQEGSPIHYRYIYYRRVGTLYK